MLTKCPLMDERINKIQCTHTRYQYSALKRKEFLTYALTWINLENITRVKSARHKKGRYGISVRSLEGSQPQRREADGGCWGLEGRCSPGAEFHFCKMEKFWRCWWSWLSGNMKVLNTPELILKYGSDSEFYVIHILTQYRRAC